MVVCHTVTILGPTPLTPNYFTYDALKRRNSTTFNNITSSNILDAVGHSAKSIRIGSDATLITQGQTVYETSGRVIEQTNAVSARTGTRYSTDSLKTTNIYADDSTRIETHFMDGRLQSVTGSAVHGVRCDYGVISDGGTYRLYEARILLDSGGSDTLETVTNYFDMLGRIYKTAYPSATGPIFSVSYFNTNGQSTNDIDPDGVSTLYVFNAKGEQSHTVIDMNQDHVIDFAGADRITMVTNDVVSDNGSDVRRARTYAWATSADSAALVSTTETSVDGLRSWNMIWNSGTAVTSSNVTIVDAATGRRILTSYAPDGSYMITTNQNGRLISVTKCDANGSQIGQTIYGYDAHGRQTTNSDARTGATTFSFDAADQNTGVTSPDPGSGAQVTTKYFDSRGRVWKIGYPDGTSITNVFYPTGELELRSGSRTYPTGYRRDGQGRITGMTNWTTFPSAGARMTSWTNDPYRGFLINKTYPDNNGTTYAYTPAGRLKLRTWARGITTTKNFNNAGDLSTVTFSDGTAALTNIFDRRGRAITNIQGSATCVHAFNDPGQLLSESYIGGPLDGISATNAYDAVLRRIKQVTLLNGSVLTTTTNGFDAASRLQVVSDGTNAATYGYLANSALVTSLTFEQNGSNRLAVRKTFDNLSRLTALTNSPSGDAVLSFNYAYNSANQRTAVTNQDSSRWAFTNDFLGQVVAGKKYWSDGTAVAGQQFEYGFDDIGNRTYASSGGDASGANLRTQTYTVNNLNQYTQRTVPGYVDVLGAATNTANVAVNNALAYRKGEYYRMELTEANGGAAVWQSVTNVALLVQSTNSETMSATTGSVFIAQSPESFGYDADGNQTNDGRWIVSWDALNH